MNDTTEVYLVPTVATLKKAKQQGFSLCGHCKLQQVLSSYNSFKTASKDFDDSSINHVLYANENKVKVAFEVENINDTFHMLTITLSILQDSNIKHVSVLVQPKCKPNLSITVQLSEKHESEQVVIPGTSFTASVSALKK